MEDDKPKNQSTNMADSQNGLSTPNGNIVSFDDLNAILKSVDSGQPFKVLVLSNSVRNGRKRIQLQIQTCTEVGSDTKMIVSNGFKPNSEPYDSRALVKQLQNLRLSDEGILEQILTSSQPAALSELSAAHKNNRMIPLVTAKDGRVFSILAAPPAYSNWGGKYPMDFPRGPVRKLSDSTLADEKITTYRKDALIKIMEAVTHMEDSREFRNSVQFLHPEIWDHYKMLIAEPVNLESIHLRVYHDGYANMADFRRHVDLLEENAKRYNGSQNKSIATAAAKVKNDIYRRMDEIAAEPPLGGKNVTQIRQLIYAYDDGVADGADGDGCDHSSHEEDVGSEAGTEDNDESFYVLPLGRLCVAHSSGGDEIIVTPYIVVMDLEYSCKTLWLVKDMCTPLGLPDNKKRLLDFGGKFNFTAGKLAADISEWKVRRSPGPPGGLKNTQAPTLSWTRVVELIRESSDDEAVLFDLVQTQQAAAAIERGWEMPTESAEGDEDCNNGGSDGSNSAAAMHTGHRACKRRFVLDSEDEDDDKYSGYEPPRKLQTRAAAQARLSSGKRH